MMLVTGQYYDLNTTEFTTNYFQAYDVALTNGVNTFTLHVTDLAGNVTTLTTNFTVDYTGLTNPPVVQVSWPKTGAYLSGNSFNVSGQVADPTVTVSAQLVDTNSVTNVVAGVVGRDGQFWVQNLPLHSGTNLVALSVQDVLGHTTTTNLTLIQSAATVTIDPVVAGQVTVTGTVSASGYSVLVNGVAATVSGTNWSAQIAPVTIGGGTVAAMAVSGSGPTNQTQTLVTPPQGVYMQTYNLHDYWHFYFPPLAGGGTNVIETKIDWTNGVGGQGYYYWKNDFATWDNDQYFWPTVLWPQWQSPGPTLWQWNSSTTNWDVTTNATTLNSYLQGEHCDMSSSVLGAPFTTQRRTADAEYELATGGPLGSTNLNLWVLSATARSYTNTTDTVGIAIPPNQIALGNFGNLDTNGNLYVVLPDNDPDVITPRVPGKDKISFSPPTAQEYKLRIYFNGTDVTDSNVTAIVGQKISLTCALVGPTNSTPPPITNFAWSIPGMTFSNYAATPSSAVLYTNYSKTNSGVDYYWTDAANNRQVRGNVKAAGQSLSAQTTFNVLRPTAQIITTGGNVALDYYHLGATRLHCGDADATVGMLFNVTNFSVPSQFAGNTNINWFQVATSQTRREQASSGTWYQQLGTNLCDGGTALGSEFPYGFDPSFIYPRTSDSPKSRSLANYIGVSYSDSFDMWLMYKPNGGQWVPLQKVSWHWDGAGNWNGTNWVMTSHTDPGNHSGTDTTTHPIWTGNTDDLQWQP
jgi:hypothetical protein